MGTGIGVLFLYNVFLFFAIIMGFPLVVPIILTSDKRRRTFLQRLGLAPMPPGLRRVRFYCSGKKTIWVHALSVGEVFSAVPLVKKLKDRFSDQGIVVSVSTKTGFEIANSLFSETVDAVFFYPYDLIFSVRRISAGVDPAIVVIVETDIWPNFLFDMRKRSVPLILVNARLSKRSFKGYKRLRFFALSLFSSFSTICTQSEADAARFSRLGIPSNRITVTGNFKFDREKDAVPEREMENLRRSMRLDPFQKVFLAGSTHDGEEEILCDAFSRLKKECQDMLLVLAPRDPERAGSISRMFRTAGFSSVLMKEIEKANVEQRFDVIVVDTIGVLKRLYALADVAFVGGSLVKCGGHNPLEPAAYARPILFGPDMSDFAEISEMLLASEGAIRVEDTGSLCRAVIKIAGDTHVADRMGNNAFNVFSDNSGAVEKTLKVIESFL
ncbi:MAG: 3-deoxy-D-manno-octulosonic acid transferase [Deltaproteobacteria bacterium]|nr:3-deoxy-D-manno-octulosonic acid transferase [Deltaproteobacteria bacterium]